MEKGGKHRGEKKAVIRSLVKSRMGLAETLGYQDQQHSTDLQWKDSAFDDTRRM